MKKISEKHTALPDDFSPAVEPGPNKRAALLVDDIALTLEKRGLWRRAAARWLVVLDSVIDDKTREAASLRRNHCGRMAAGTAPKFKDMI